MHISLGFSPCPNDCFIFDAMLHQRIDTEGLSFDVLMLDVEELNRRALAGETDVTKLSYHAFACCAENYVLLDSGSALGRGCGPLLISRREISTEEIESGEQTIAIPGKLTTANFLFSIRFPKATDKTEMIFSAIEDAVLKEDVDAGLIIHENRFTYETKGLKKIIDLGAWWESYSGAAIPLGGIVIKRSLPDELKKKVNRVLRRSVEYAFAHPDDSMPFVRAHAQEMSEAVMKQHIALYVNKYSVDLGDEGRRAVITLFEEARRHGIAAIEPENIFLK